MHEKVESEISIDLSAKMVLFAVYSIHGNYDRPLDYHFSEIHINCTLYWHYGLIWLGLIKPDQTQN